MITKDMIRAAAKLEDDAKKLREAAAIMEHTPLVEATDQAGTKAEQLAAFIAAQGGGATRTQIVHGSGIKPGTIASLLGTKKKFQKDGRGYWHVKPKHSELQPPLADGGQKLA